MINELNTTPLIETCESMRQIFRNSEYFSSILFDSVKNEIVVGDRPINVTSLSVDYAVSVHHLSEETPESDFAGEEYIKAFIYVDCFKKVNRKDGNVFDEINKFSWTVLSELRQANNLNSDYIHDWSFAGGRIWTPVKNEKSDPILHLVRELKIAVWFSNIYSQLGYL